MEMIEIGQCCTVINGSTPSRKKPEYWKGEIDWFTPKDLSKIQSKYVDEAPEKITQKGYDSCSTTLIPENSLLYTSRAPIGHIAINKRTVCTNQGFKSLVPRKNVDVEYLYYTLKKYTPLLKDLGNGATFKELSKTTISSFKIPLPPLPTQKKIAALLDAADAYRQKTKALIEKYDELTQSLFLDMFGDPVRNPKNMKTILGKEMFKFSSGKYNPTKNLSDENEFPTYGGNGITGYSKDYLLDYDTIVIGRVGAYCGSIHKTHEKIWVTDNAIYIKEFKSVVNLTYVFYFFKGYNLNRFADFSGQPKITQKPLENMSFINPSIDLQNQFAERVQKIEAQKAQAQESLEKAEELFNSLLGRAFKGEIKV